VRQAQSTTSPEAKATTSQLAGQVVPDR
jgi:hypothetical protein